MREMRESQNTTTRTSFLLMHTKLRSFQTWQIVAAPLSFISKCNIILELYMLLLVSAGVNLQSTLQLLTSAIIIPPVTWKIKQRPAPFSNRLATHLLHSGSLPCQDVGKPNHDRPRMRETLFNMLPLAIQSVPTLSIISSCLHATATRTP